MSVFSHRIYRVGLTGGIAAGKTALAELWRQRGAAVIDSDELAHAALAPGTPTHAEVVGVFGTADRAALADIVFRDETKRAALNNIIHPFVRQQRDAALAKLENAGSDTVALAVVPLLYEVGAEKEMDCVVVIACSEATQLARLAAKGCAEPQARARIAAQWPIQKKMDRADFVIWNDGTRHALAEQADIIWQRIQEAHHATRPIHPKT